MSPSNIQSCPRLEIQVSDGKFSLQDEIHCEVLTPSYLRVSFSTLKENPIGFISIPDRKESNQLELEGIHENPSPMVEVLILGDGGKLKCFGFPSLSVCVFLDSQSMNLVAWLNC